MHLRISKVKNTSSSFSRSLFLNIRTWQLAYWSDNIPQFLEWKAMTAHSNLGTQLGAQHSRHQCLGVWECARKLWETLRRRSQNLAIWASQRILFDPTKTLCFFYIYFIAEVLCCFVIRTGEIQLTEPLTNFQVSNALVVAAEKIPLSVLNHMYRFDTWSLHMLTSWLYICVDYFSRR